MTDIENMIECRINAVNDTAFSEVGYKEKKNNITKYGKDFDEIYKGFYYGTSQAAEWCDMFFDWCMVKEFGVELALKMLYQPKKSYGRSCSWSYDYYKSHNATGTKPKKGAQVFFKNTKTGKICHTGRVIRIFTENKKEYIAVVEGNKNNAVQCNNYLVSSTKIYGYGYPDYGVGLTEVKTPEVKKDVKKEVKPVKISKEVKRKMTPLGLM